MFVTRLLFLAVLWGTANACLATDPGLPEPGIPEVPTDNKGQVLIVKEANPVPVEALSTPPSPLNPVPQAMKESLEVHCNNRPKQEKQTYQTTIADEVIHVDGTLIFNKEGVKIEDLKKFLERLKEEKKWYPVIQAVFAGRRFVEVFTPEFLGEYTLNVTPTAIIGRPNVVVIDADVQEATDEALGLKEDESGKIKVDYTDLLIEEDQGDVIRPDSKVQWLRAVNIAGPLYVEPATDGQVSWAARKWVLAEKTRGGKKAMGKDVKLYSLTDHQWDRIEVKHPGNNKGSVPRTRYQVCLVIKAPPELLHSLKNDSGVIESQDHSGPLVVESDVGDMRVRKAGNHDVWLSSGSGRIKIIQNGTGDLFAQNEAGTILVESNSRIAARLLNSVGATTYILRDGGVPLQREVSILSEAGAIKVFADPKVGFLLDASVDIAASSGSIFLPADLPRPRKSGLTERASGPVQGGKARLALHTHASPITVSNDQAPSLEVRP